MLFHVSEEASIERFEPRWSESVGDKVVWAIDEDRLHNYLLPRECPRVTYYAGSQTASEDVDRFLGTSKAVVAVESHAIPRSHSSQHIEKDCQERDYKGDNS